MAYAIQSAFGAGELAPELHQRTTLEKYKTGLKTLRNAYVGKTGKLISRPGTVFSRSTKRNTTLVDLTFTTDHTTEVFTTSAAHGLVTGQAVQLTTTGTLPAGTSLATTYYVSVLSTTTFKLAIAITNAITGLTILITDNGSGIHTLSITDKLPKKAIIYHPDYSDYVVEFGDLYVRIHNVPAGTYEDGSHYFTESDLPNIQFAYGNNEYVYIAVAGKNAQRMFLGTLIPGDPYYANRMSDYTIVVGFPPNNPFGVSPGIVATGAPAGYDVEYGYTYFIDGQESEMRSINVAAKIPVAAAQYNTLSIVLTLFSYQLASATKLYIYRRPKQGQAYGFIGVSDSYADAASPPYTDRTFTFIDFGQTSDFTHLPPIKQQDFDVDTYSTGVRVIQPNAIALYQQSVVLNGTLTKNREATFKTRPGYPLNFLRNYPLDAESALAMKAGTTGTAKVLRYADIGGLVAFTTQGIYSTPNGPLTPETAYMINRGGYVIDEILPPLKVPGAVLFVDKSTNSVIAIGYSDDQASFVGAEISIYSSHLLKGKRIVSWVFQGGITPLVWCVMDDGSLLALTWQNEQLVRAWARGDTDGLFESVAAYKNDDGTQTVYFVVNRDGSRSIETLSSREFDSIVDFIGMDSTVTYKSVIENTFTAVPVVATDWEGLITLGSSSAAFANTSGNGAVGTIFRIFAPDGASCDLEVVTYTSTTSVIVQPAYEYPQDMQSFTDLYRTTNVVTGLDHLEGKNVSVMLDGYIEGSPNNLIDGHEAYTVTSGSITLADSKRGAIIHVGLPFVVDIETLDVETVEQKPTLLESILCNKVLINLHDSRGFWVGQEFGDDDTNEDMASFEMEEEVDGDVNLAPKAMEPYTKREEVTITGNWQSQGRIAIRQIDPLPLEILSITPDIQVEYKR